MTRKYAYSPPMRSESMIFFFMAFACLIAAVVYVSARTPGTPNIVVMTAPQKDDAMLTPPLKVDYSGTSPRGINMRTRDSESEYSQVGILKKKEGEGDSMILPLFGRKSDTNRNNYQYYTMSNTGVVNTKLPIMFNNRKGTSETGCDEIGSGDSVFVDGYDSTFKASVYDNAMYRYLPW